jgi:uncharacterized protein YllA (UPF0747 family)
MKLSANLLALVAKKILSTLRSSSQKSCQSLNSQLFRRKIEKAGVIFLDSAAPSLNKLVAATTPSLMYMRKGRKSTKAMGEEVATADLRVRLARMETRKQQQDAKR